jgi:hypothetical protein
MNGAAQVKAPPAPMYSFAANKARAHDARKPRGECMCLRDIGGIDDVAQIGAGQILEARRAFAFAAAVVGVIAIVIAPLDMIWKARRSRARAHVLELARRHAVFQR